MRAVLSVGTNIGDRKQNIIFAKEALSLLPKTKVLRCSPVYETEPWGYTQQDNFYNCAILLETDLSPRVLLGACLGIEAQMGRIRQFKNGPRIIDLDLLLYENFTSDDEELTVPHKYIRQRDFVLVPLFDLFPEGNALGYDFLEPYTETDKSKLKPVE